MTNNEIMRASLLDILFDGRNKSYGAYALRRGYNYRLLKALGVGTSLIVLAFLLTLTTQNSKETPPRLPDSGNGLQLIEIELPKDDPKLPEPVKPKTAHPKPPEQVATAKLSTLQMVKDNEIIRTEMPDLSDLKNKEIGFANIEGPPASSIVKEKTTVSEDGGGGGEKTESVETGPTSAPEFPGGYHALMKFLMNNLNTPSSLDIGEKKTVKARFLVDKDGSVSTVEIDLSAGKIFDREVIRVCKRMPKWKPALQNGRPVAVSYVLPVTFIGVEQ